MKGARVAVANNLHDDCREILSQHGYEVVPFDPHKDKKPEEALHRIQDEIGDPVDGWIQRTDPYIISDKALNYFLQFNPKILVRAGIGVDNLYVDGIGTAGVVVENTAGCSTRAVAAHTFKLMREAGKIAREGYEIRGKDWA